MTGLDEIVWWHCWVGHWIPARVMPEGCTCGAAIMNTLGVQTPPPLDQWRPEPNDQGRTIVPGLELWRVERP